MSDCTRKAGTTKTAKMSRPRPKNKSPSKPNKKKIGSLKLNLWKMVKSKKKEERAPTKILCRRTCRKKIRNRTLKENKFEEMLTYTLTRRRISMMLCQTKVKEQEKSESYLKMLTNQRSICQPTM